jgi:hypothetical protein
MWRVFGGAVLVIAGIAAFIEAHSHRPSVITNTVQRGFRTVTVETPAGLSHTAYELLRIGGWALVIIGALLVIVGFIGYWARVKRPA